MPSNSCEKNKSERRLQVEEEIIHHNKSNVSSGRSRPSSPKTGISRTNSSSHSDPPLEPTSSHDTDHLHSSLKSSGFHPEDSISFIGVTDPNFLDLSLGDHLEGNDVQKQNSNEDTKATSGSSPLIGGGSERSLSSNASRRSQRYPVDPNRPKFVPPPPRKSKYQLAEEAALAAAQANARKPGWGTFTRNISFLTSSVSRFVDDRKTTFSQNLNVVGELLTNQRDFSGLDAIEEDGQGS